MNLNEAKHSANYNSMKENKSPQSHSKNKVAIADTGCTGHFLKTDSHCINEKATNNGIKVVMPNRATIVATHTCQLDYPDLPTAATEGHKFDNLAHPLMLIG